MKFLASYILSGRRQAVAVAAGLLAVSLLLPPLGLLSSAAVALVTLRQGSRQGAAVMAWAALLSAVLGGIVVGSPHLFAVYGAIMWLPIWLVATVLRVRIDLAAALEMGVALAMACVLGVYAWVDSPSGLWQGNLERMLAPLLESPPPGIMADQVRERMDFAAHYMTGMAAAGAFLGVALSLFLARGWQAQLFNPGGFIREYKALRGGGFLGVVSIGLLLGLFAGDAALAEWMGNLFLPAVTYYAVAGVAVLHEFCTRTAFGRWLLLVLYSVVLALPHALIPVALVGLSDIWGDWRRLGSGATTS